MSELESWSRPHVKDDAGEPFLFYVVYGDIDVTKPLSRKTYRTNGCPQGIDVMGYGPEMHPEVPASFCEGYVWDIFVEEDPETAAQVSASSSCLTLQGTPADATSLDYLRDLVGLMTFFLDNGGCAIYDPFMIRWWSPEDWRNFIFEPAGPVPTHHTTILLSPEDDPALTWYHTRGMRKFGRPDISVPGVPRQHHDAIVALCNRLIETQAFGLTVLDGQDVRMDSLPEGGVFQNAGSLDDPDFNNVHLEITWPKGW